MEHKGTKFSLTVDDTTVIWECPYFDCSMDDLLNAFYGILIAHTWLPSTVLEGMRDFANEQLEVLKQDEKIS